MRHGSATLLAPTLLVGCCLSVLATACKVPDPLYCDENTPCKDPDRPFCDFEGTYPASQGVGRTCIPDPGSGADAGFEPACESEGTTCQDDQLVVCSAAGADPQVTDCPLGCNADESRCYDIDPSNGLGVYLDMAAEAPDVILTDGAQIYTNDGTVTNGDGSTIDLPRALIPAPDGGVDVRVLVVKSLTMVDTVIFGDPGLAIVSEGPIRIVGDVKLDNSGFESVPGQVGPSICGPIPDGDDANVGAGGGGFATAGGKGGNHGASDGATGRGASGEATLVPLRGGCSGGSMGGGTFALGGLGGGAIQLVSRTRIEIGPSNGAASSIQAPGMQGAAAGVGGGSGGAILLEAPVVSVSAGAGMQANGAGGGCNGQAGAPGSLTTSAAQGGQCADANGGNGGSADSLPGDGGNVSGVGDLHGGGGGGAAGRIRINTADGQVHVEDGAILSPRPSTGNVSRR